MNAAHFHIVICHLPIVGIPIAAIFLAYATWTKQASAQKFALLMLAVFSFLSVPAFFSGDAAEGLIEEMPGFSDVFIEPHEKAGGVALAISLLAGASSLLALWAAKKPKLSQTAVRAAIVFAALASLVLIYVGSLGGQIRHSEIRGGEATTEAEP